MRCTHCGSTFAFNPAQVQRGDPATDPVRWVRVEGEDFAVSDLATLQRWILEKRVLPQDVASCDGIHWFALDSRAELTLFFDAADRMDRGPASAQHAMMTMSRSTASDIFADDAPLPEPDPLAGAAAIAEGMAADSTDMEAIAADEGDPSDDMGSLRLDFGQSSPDVRRRDGGDAHPVPPPALLGDEEAEAPSGPSAPAGSAAIRVGVLGGGSSAQRERSVPVVVQTRAADPSSRPLAVDPASNPAVADPRSGPTPSRPVGASASEGAEVAGGWEDSAAHNERTEPVSVARAVKVPTLVKPPGANGDGPSIARPTVPVPTQPVIPRGPPTAAQFSPGQATEERPNLTVRPEADPRAAASPWAIALVVASAVFVIVVAVQQFGGRKDAAATEADGAEAAASSEAGSGRASGGEARTEATPPSEAATGTGASPAGATGSEGDAATAGATPAAASTGTASTAPTTTSAPATTTATPAAATGTAGASGAPTSAASTGAASTSAASTTRPSTTTAGTTARPATTSTTAGTTTRPTTTTSTAGTTTTGSTTAGATTRPTTTSATAGTTTRPTTSTSGTTTASTGSTATTGTTSSSTGTSSSATRPTTSTAPTTVISGSTTTTAKPPTTTTTTTTAKTKPSTSAAWALVQARDYQAAYDMFDTLAASGSSSAVYGRGYAAEKLGRTDAALADYCRAIASTNNEETLRELSAGLRRLGRTCP